MRSMFFHVFSVKKHNYPQGFTDRDGREIRLPEYVATPEASLSYQKAAKLKILESMANNLNTAQRHVEDAVFSVNSDLELVYDGVTLASLDWVDIFNTDIGGDVTILRPKTETVLSSIKYNSERHEMRPEGKHIRQLAVTIPATKVLPSMKVLVSLADATWITIRPFDASETLVYPYLANANNLGNLTGLILEALDSLSKMTNDIEDTWSSSAILNIAEGYTASTTSIDILRRGMCVKLVAYESPKAII